MVDKELDLTPIKCDLENATPKVTTLWGHMEALIKEVERLRECLMHEKTSLGNAANDLLKKQNAKLQEEVKKLKIDVCKAYDQGERDGGHER